MYKLSQIPEEYKKKLITAEQAAALVKDGDRVSYGLGCAAPYDIDIEIGKRAKDLHGVEIVARPSSKMNPMRLISTVTRTNRSASQRLI